MYVTQTDVVPTTLTSDTWLTIRESNTYNRMMAFRNLTDTTLSIRVEFSIDGGSSWEDAVATFDLAPGESTSKLIEDDGILRVVGSGVNDNEGLEISYFRIYENTSQIWQSPSV
jgi:hypothetical protein